MKVLLTRRILRACSEFTVLLADHDTSRYDTCDSEDSTDDTEVNGNKQEKYDSYNDQYEAADHDDGALLLIRRLSPIASSAEIARTMTSGTVLRRFGGIFYCGEPVDVA